MKPKVEIQSFISTPNLDLENLDWAAVSRVSRHVSGHFLSAILQHPLTKNEVLIYLW